jgi:site-specific DNA-methyltransferase (adenine-specific)
MDIKGDGWKVLAGSCLDRLLELEDCSIDAVVTDPPYELGFMGKSWDSSGIAYNVEVWRQCLRVLKPGGHILAFGGSRTWHRLAVAIEDAGFELRDSIAWIYGSGFPKSLDVSKAIDKAFGAERQRIELIGGALNSGTANGWNGSSEHSISAPLAGTRQVDQPITDDAQKWQGWGTALKPAFEPVVVGRKPLTGTVAANVLEWGVGGLNIDGTRIGTDGGTKGTGIDLSHRVGDAKTGFRKNNEVTQINAGRWPSNVMLDEFTAGLVDQQSGVSVSKRSLMGTMTTEGSHEGYKRESHEGFESVRGFNDSGGASRFFYVAKASKRDRNEGLDGLEAKQSFGGGGGVGDYLEDVNSASGKYGSEKAPAKNFHPTVKPTELMRNLIRLVTPLGGTVLDPFTGSGSTGKAAILEGMQFVGCELTPEYLPIIEGRINYAVSVKEQEALAENEKLF